MRRQYLLAQSNCTAPSQISQSNGFDLHCARTLTAWRNAKKDRARAREKDKENEGSGGVGVGGYLGSSGSGSGSGSDVTSVYEKRQGGGFGLGFGGLSSSSGSRGNSAGASGGYGDDGLLDDGMIRDVDSSSSSNSVPGGGGGRSAFGGMLGFNFAAKPQASTSSSDANTVATTTTANGLDDAIASGMLPDSFSGGSSETVPTPPVPPKPTAKPAVKNMLDMY